MADGPVPQERYSAAKTAVARSILGHTTAWPELGPTSSVPVYCNFSTRRQSFPSPTGCTCQSALARPARGQQAPELVAGGGAGLGHRPIDVAFDSANRKCQ